MSETKPLDETASSNEAATPLEESDRPAEMTSEEEVSSGDELPRMGEDEPADTASKKSKPDETEPVVAEVTAANAALPEAAPNEAETDHVAPNEAEPTEATLAGAVANAAVRNGAEPTDPGAANAKPTDAEPTDAEPTDAEPTDAEPTDAEPAAAEPTAAEPTAAEPTAAEPTAAEPTAAELTAAELSAAEPTAAEPTAAELSAAEPTAAELTDAEPIETGATDIGADSETAEAILAGTPEKPAAAPPPAGHAETPNRAEPGEGTEGGPVSAWRIVAEWSGLTRVPDLPYVLWSLLWASWLASEGAPRWPRLLALVIAVTLARSAAWVAYVPEATQLSKVLRERWLLFIALAIGALCFALPLGWAGMLVPASLALLAGWFALRQRSYLSDAVLILAVAAPAAAGWLVQSAPLTKAAGLLWLAIFLWLAAALIATPVQRNTANLAALSGNQAPFYSAGLKLLALGTLFLVGRQAHLGIFFQLGMATSLALLIYDLWASRRGEQLKRVVLDAWWGTAIFCGIAFHFLCACQVAGKV